jgi:hypothetical protein
MYNAWDIRRPLDESGHSGTSVRPFVETGHGRFEGEPIYLRDEINVMLRAGTSPALG